MAKWLSTFSFLAVLCSAGSAAAEDPTFAENFRDAVDAIRGKQYGLAIKKLERAKTQKDDPRLAYYLGFANEKIGNCLKAKGLYQQALRDDRAAFALRETAQKALLDFEERCPTTRTVRPIVEPPPEPSSNAGWITVGWLATVFGTLALVAIPVKGAIESGTFSDAEHYFEIEYGCDVNRANIDPACSDADAIRADPVYTEYDKKISSSKTSTTVLVVAGITTATLGVITLVTVAIVNSRAEVSLRANGASIKVHF